MIEKLPKHIIYQGKKIKLRLWFDHVILVFKLLKDEHLTQHNKINLAFKLLCKTYRKHSFYDKNKILEKIFTQLIADKGKVKKEQKPSIDFYHDSNYIYASFMHQYNIDLYKMNGKLRWEKFIQLFNGLDSNTLIKKIIEIRTMDLPKPDKHNMEHRKKIQELKLEYSLLNYMSDSEKQKHENESKKKLFDNLIKLAERR